MSRARSPYAPYVRVFSRRRSSFRVCVKPFRSDRPRRLSAPIPSSSGGNGRSFCTQTQPAPADYSAHAKEVDWFVARLPAWFDENP
jgi:hypothetical protein